MIPGFHSTVNYSKKCAPLEFLLSNNLILVHTRARSDGLQEASQVNFHDS